MNHGVGLSQGMREIIGHPLRSAIALLAIVLGAGSLLATFALTEGMARQERYFLQATGGVERFRLRPAPIPEGQEEMKDASPGITMRDVETLRAADQWISHVTPTHRLGPTPAISYRDKQILGGRVTGISPEYLRVMKHTVASGRFISALDVSRSRPVCVLGSSIVDELGLTAHSAVGKTIYLDNVLFEVVGTLETPGAFWMANEVLLPHTTAFRMFEDGKVDSQKRPTPGTRLAEIAGLVRDPDKLEESIDAVKGAILRNHRGVEDFEFQTSQEWSDTIEKRINALRISGAVIAAVSLLVGGIGVTNVMLAAIKQRIREIGVRRALGACRSDIFMQIMLEATLLALLGGVLGIFAGWCLVGFFKLAAVSKAVPIILPVALAWSFGAAMLTGILAGIYPAIKGSEMSPIEALRYE